MRTEEPRPIRLKDYRPPDWLIETVDLDVSLDPTATIVRAKLKLKPNTTGTPAPLVLDGDELKLRSLALDGKPLPGESFLATPERLTIAQPPNRPFTLEIETVIDPSANTQLMGLYRAGATYCTQCEAEGFRRITYFLDRPDVMAVYTTRIEADKSEAPILLSNGNLVARATWRAPTGISPCGTTRSKSPVICSRWSAVIWHASPTAFAPGPAAMSRCTSMSSPARKIAVSTRWTASSAPCAGTKRRSGANTISTSS